MASLSCGRMPCSNQSCRHAHMCNATKFVLAGRTFAEQQCIKCGLIHTGRMPGCMWYFEIQIPVQENAGKLQCDHDDHVGKMNAGENRGEAIIAYYSYTC